ncbi:hypothetical protein EGD00_19780 [Pectobacterium carotovorum subsp. carotovorum]|nr:hypothetical protein EGD00_19780 [Pectobacterium carotovorum subsp. carotovorum]
MAFVKMLVTALGNVVAWCSSIQAQRFVTERFQQAGCSEEEIEAAREAAFLLMSVLTGAVMDFILRAIFPS